MISLTSLLVQFGELKAVDDVSVVLSGAVTGIIGPNGAGKTTMLNAIAGTVPATGGVLVHDVDVSPLKAYERARHGVRRTFQADQVIRQLNVIDNVLVGGEVNARSDRGGLRDQAARLLEFVGLPGAHHRPAAALTNIERRKVEVARSLMGEPLVLLLDEPGAGLLGDEKAELELVISAIPEEIGAQVVLIEHDIDLVGRICDQCVVLDFGRLIADGLPSEVLASPEVRAAYLGESVDTVAAGHGEGGTDE